MLSKPNDYILSLLEVNILVRIINENQKYKDFIDSNHSILDFKLVTNLSLKILIKKQLFMRKVRVA